MNCYYSSKTGNLIFHWPLDFHVSTLESYPRLSNNYDLKSWDSELKLVKDPVLA